MITREQAQELEKEAQANNGKCSHCHHTIKIYTYGISKVMAKLLMNIAVESIRNESRAVDVEKVSIIHGERTQITKLRTHGLITKVKDENGKHESRMWLVTKKGWSFLNGAAIPDKVTVYNNQVIGHSENTTTISRITGNAINYEQEALTEPEARVFSDVRKATRGTTYEAEWLGYSGHALKRGSTYTIRVDRMQVGKPVNMTVVLDDNSWDGVIEYTDINAFRKCWKVTS